MTCTLSPVEMPKNQTLFSRRAHPHPQTQRPFPVDILLRLRLERHRPLTDYFGSKYYYQPFCLINLIHLFIRHLFA